MNSIRGLIDKYKSTCSVPKHPKSCPECGQKVRVYHLNYSEAVFMCSNGECVWPLATYQPEEILGKSDVATLVKIAVKREAQGGPLLSDPYSVDDDDDDDDDSNDVDSNKVEDKSSTDERNEFPKNDASIKGSSTLPNPSKDSAENRIEQSPKETKEPFSKEESRTEELQSQHMPMDTSENEPESDHAKKISEESSEFIDKFPDEKEGPSSTESHKPTKSTESQKPTESHKPSESHKPTEPMELSEPKPMEPTQTTEPTETTESKPTDKNESHVPSSLEESMDIPNLLSPMTPMTPMTPMPPSPAVDVSNLLSPMTPSPARPASTPLRDDNDEFLRPSSTFGTPRRLATPMHLPPPISPLPATPRRGSERSINLDYDLQLTDSEWSDVESTPRHLAFRSNDGLDMPKIFASPKSKPSYSKDLGKIAHGESDQTIPGTPMKLKIKRHSGNEWNVEKTPEPSEDVVLPDRPTSGKLDKVVLNLKKSVTSNTWYAPQPQDVNVEQLTVPQTMPQSVLPKEERRGRKSKVAPMKIQNVQALTSESGGQKQTPRIPDVPNVVEKHPIAKQSDTVNPEVQNEAHESQASSSNKPEVSSTLKSTMRSGLKSFARVKSKSVASKPLAPKLVVTKVSNDGTNWAEIAELSSQAANAFKQDDGFNEFCQLMKAATGDKQVDLNFIQKVQKQLSISTSSNSRSQVTFHVSQNKANIDLPTEESSMSVSDSSSAVQVMLSAESDGIVGDVLKNKEPIPFLVQDHKKRGRPSKPKPNITSSPPPTMVPPPMSAVTRQFIPRPSSDMDDLLRNPQAINNFMSSLQSLMDHYQLPIEWSQYSNVDPYVAMMVTRSQDEAYREINFEAMLHFYAQIRNQQHYQQQLGYGGQPMVPPRPPPPNTSSTDLRPANERSYAELQTVRGGSEVTDATQVLRQHQQESNEPEVVETVEPAADEEQRPIEPPQTQGQRLVIKQEAMTPPQVIENGVGGSVSLLSVRPNQNPRSVEECGRGLIGKGNKIVQFTYKNCNFGPIFVETDEEVRAIAALTEAKIQEREYRDKHGGRRSNGVIPSSEATRARSFLKPDIVQYLDKAFTKKGMNENVIGRKRRNYPKRSKIIKEDPITKELILHDGTRMMKSSLIKEDVENSDALGNIPALPPPTHNSILDQDPLDEEPLGIDDDLPNPLNKDELDKSNQKHGKISTAALFKKKKPRPDKRTREESDNVEMIDTIISNHELEKAKTKADAAKNNNAQKDISSGFNPASLFEQTFIRKEQEAKVKRLLEKKKKKEERQQRKAVKRTSKYTGIGQAASASSTAAKRFKKAPQTIGGRKMVLKESGDIVELDSKKSASGPNSNNRVTQDERDFIDELIRECNAGISSTATVSTGAPPGNKPGDLEVEPAALDVNTSVPSTATKHNLPEFDFHFDGAHEKDFSSLDDIFN